MAHRWFPLQKLPSAKGCCGAPCYGSFPSNHQTTQVFKAPSPTPPLPQLEIIVYEHLSMWVTCCNCIKVQQILLPNPPSVTSLEFFSWECSPRNFLHTNLCSVCFQGTRSKTEQTSVVLIKKMKGWISSLLLCFLAPWTLEFFDNSCSCLKTPGNGYDRHFILATPAGLITEIRNVSQTDHPPILHPVGVDTVSFYYKVLYGVHAKVGLFKKKKKKHLFSLWTSKKQCLFIFCWYQN